MLIRQWDKGVVEDELNLGEEIQLEFDYVAFVWEDIRVEELAKYVEESVQRPEEAHFILVKPRNKTEGTKEEIKDRLESREAEYSLVLVREGSNPREDLRECLT